MRGVRRFSRRRPVVVGFGVFCLSVLTSGFLAAPAFGESAAAEAARATALVPRTPCTITAKACVDLEAKHAWLFENGKIRRGPVDISAGGPGEETPTGHSLRVYRKEKDHVSQESRRSDGQPAKMPYSVFFEDGGIAFHGGDPNRDSAGCIHLERDDAKAWYEYLQIGDQVQVVYGSEELAARRGESTGERNSDKDSVDDPTTKAVTGDGEESE